MAALLSTKKKKKEEEEEEEHLLADGCVRKQLRQSKPTLYCSICVSLWKERDDDLLSCDLSLFRTVTPTAIEASV